jgi:hypothetical protein
MSNALRLGFALLASFSEFRPRPNAPALALLHTFLHFLVTS